MMSFGRFLTKCICYTIIHPKASCLEVGNPVAVQQSPVPWRVSVIVLFMGIVSLTIGECLSVAALNECGRAMVYMPLGSIFGMGTQAYSIYRKGMNEDSEVK